MEELVLRPIGYVRNSIHNRSEMTAAGTRSVIEFLPEFSEAIDSIEENSHLIVSGYFHCGKRDVLKVHPRKFKVYSISERGVLSTRSPDRPNPISFTVVRLLGKTGPCSLEVEGLDLIDGTPVVDIKPYTIDDAIFNSFKTCVSHSFAGTDEKLLYSYIKSGAERYLFVSDDKSLDSAAACFVRLIRKLETIPDRHLIQRIETDFTGGALDCIYYWTRLTPGEVRLSSSSSESENTFIRFYLISGGVLEACLQGSEWAVEIR